MNIYEYLIHGKECIYKNPKILILFFSIFTLMRLVFINADPPQDLSFSAALYTDEGFKTYEARNYIHFGDWKWTSSDMYWGWKSESPLPVYTYLNQLFQL